MRGTDKYRLRYKTAREVIAPVIRCLIPIAACITIIVI